MNANNIVYKILLVVGILCLPAMAAFAAETPEGSFVAEEHQEIVEALGDHEYAEGVLEALADAGTNWVELWEAIETLEGTTWTHACWLVSNMPHLDRLEMTSETLLEHVRFAYATRTQLPYITPDELFKEYILTYRIGDEPVRPWRAEIWSTYTDLAGDTPADTARAINQWVADNLTTRERGFFGPRPDPLSVIGAGSGTESDISAVAIAMCKTFGVAARRARISVLGEEEGGYTWLEIYSDDDWLPMYPDHPEAFGDYGFIEREHPRNVTVVSVSSAFTNAQATSRYSDTGQVTLHFTRNDEPAEDFEHFAISAWNNGAWLPLDDLGFDLEEERMTADVEEGFPAVLGNGFYVLQYGSRNARGDAYVQTVPLAIDPGDELVLTLAIDIPASETEAVDLIQRTIDPLPEIDFSYASDQPGTLMFPDGLPEDKFTCVLVFDSAAEPSIRMVPSIINWARGAGVSVYGIGVGDEIDAGVFWMQHVNIDDTDIAFIADPDGVIAEAFGHAPDDSGAFPKLPFVLLVSPTGDVRYLWEGYNLAVADGLARAIELAALD